MLNWIFALTVVGEAALDVHRAPQSAPIAKSIHEEVNVVLSDEPGYRAASDAEFADLIWGGVSQGGSEVSLQQLNRIYRIWVWNAFFPV